MKFKKILSALTLSCMIIPIASCSPVVKSISADVPDTVYVGETKVLTVNFEPAEADKIDYTFSSSNENILSVNGNVIEGISVGDVKLTLTSADKNIDPVIYDVSVAHKMPIGFTTNIPSEMPIGKEIVLQVAFTPDDATYKDYEVIVEDKTLISYDKEKNTLTALAAGKTNVKVQCGEIINTYPVEVKHILPTALEANIPSKMTTIDSILLDVKLTPENATLTKFLVDVKNTDVLAYNPVEKTLTAKAIGESDVVVSIKDTNVNQTYHVEVVKGYSAPKNYEAYVNFVKDVFPRALDNASQIKVTNKHINAFSKVLTETNSEYRRSDNAVSSKTSVKEGTEVTNFETLASIKDNKLTAVSTNPDNETFQIKNIVDEPTKDTEISSSAAKEALKLNLLDDILNHLDGYFDEKINNAVIDPETGYFTITYTTIITNNGDKTTTETSISSNKEGRVDSIALKQSILKQGETTEIQLYDDTFTFVYGDRYAEKDLFINDLTKYNATSFDVTYSQGLNLNVGDKFYEAYIKVSNVLPETALNMNDYDIEIIDPNNILSDGYPTVFEKAGSVTINVSPRYFIGEKLTKSFVLTASIPEAESFEYVKLDTTDTEFKVGSTYNLDAKISPAGAEQGYKVTTNDSDKVQIIEVNEHWSVKLLKAGEATLTFKANSNEMIQKTLKITIVDDKPETTPAYVGQYDFTIGYFDFTLTLNEHDGVIINKNNGKEQATVQVVEVYGKSTLFIDLQFNVTGTIDMSSSKVTSKFHLDTNILDFSYNTKGGMKKTVSIEKQALAVAPAYVGTYTGKVGGTEVKIVLEETKGAIYRIDSGALFMTLTDVTYQANNEKSGYVKFNSKYELGDLYKDGPQELLFLVEKGKLSGNFITKYDTNVAVEAFMA